MEDCNSSSGSSHQHVMTSVMLIINSKSSVSKGQGLAGWSSTLSQLYTNPVEFQSQTFREQGCSSTSHYLQRLFWKRASVEGLHIWFLAPANKQFIGVYEMTNRADSCFIVSNVNMLWEAGDGGAGEEKR